jgi:putative tributyrin esterase
VDAGRGAGKSGCIARWPLEPATVNPVEMSAFKTIEISRPEFEPEGLRLITVKSENLGGRGDITCWAPRDAADPLPLVILMHGIYGSHWAWALKGGAHRTARRLIDSGTIPPMALAMPSDGLDADGTGYFRHKTTDYERWIVDDVPKAAAEAFPTVTAASTLFIAGLSMGGFGALRLGARHGKRFAGISAHSSAVGLQQLADFIRADPASAEDPRVIDALRRHRDTLPPLRFDCGTEDRLLPGNRELHEDLSADGIPHIYEEFPGDHDWAYWETHLADTLRFFGGILRRHSA